MTQTHLNIPLIPPINRPLLEWLDQAFPEKCPDPKDTEREIWLKAGERRLVMKLRGHYNKQESS